MGDTISFIFLGIILAAAIGGYFGGFGKVLIFATKSIVGKIFALIVWYSVFGIVLNTSRVSGLLNSFVNYLRENPNFFTKVLLFIRITII